LAQGCPPPPCSVVHSVSLGVAMGRSFLVALLLAWPACAVFQGPEYAARLQRAQEMMQRQGFHALVLTMETNHIYFTGISSEFWQSPTRPYYLVVPSEGKITAVVPSIISPLYEQCSHTVGAVHSWPSPRPEDDGLSALSEVLEGVLPSEPGKIGRLGAELGWEFSLRMPMADFRRLEGALGGRAEFRDATPLLKLLRTLKSSAEVRTHKETCLRQSSAMDRMPTLLRAGMTEREVCRLARIELFRAGADRVPYMSCRSGPGGYDDIVGAATDRELQEGDVLIIDTGSMREEYFCDFNRNWFVGSEVPAELRGVQDALYSAVEAGIKTARPGKNTADLFHAMAAQLPGPESGVGRFGHSVGLAITEWPSILSAAAGQNVTLQEGMVFAVEPSLSFGNSSQFLVHEEVIVVRPDGGELLSHRGPRGMPLIPACKAGDEAASCQLA